MGSRNARVLPEPVSARIKVSFDELSKCGIVSLWISVGLEMSNDFLRCAEMTELMPRAENPLEVSNGAFVGGAGLTCSRLGEVIVISGLLVNNDED